MTTATAPAPVFHPGDKVTYLGYPAVVVHGNEPDGWTDGIPAATVNILLDRPVRGWSRQMDVAASSLLPASPLAALRAALLAGGCTAASPDTLDPEAERLARDERKD